MTDSLSYRIESLIDAEKVQTIIADLARQIVRDYADQPIVLVGVLDGAYVFLHDLSRALHELGIEDITIDFVGMDTYGSGTTSTGEPKITKDLKRDIQGKNVILVDDIVDTGFSLSILQAMLRARLPAKLATVALLSKEARRKIQVPVEYIGAQIPDKFVIGYGLDYDGRYRELPYIGIVEFTAA